MAAAAAAAFAAADDEVDVGIPLPMGPAALDTDVGWLVCGGATAAEEVAVCNSGEGVMLARAGGCPIGVIDRVPIGAGVGAGVSATDAGGAKVLVGAWIGAGSGGVADAAETAAVDPGEDCVDGVLLAVGVAEEEATLPNGAGSPLAGDCRICTGARTVAGALAVADEALEVGADGEGCCCCGGAG